MNRHLFARDARVRLTLLVGITALATACAGPGKSLDVATQALPVDLILGQHAAVVKAPLAPITLPVSPAGPAVFRPQHHQSTPIPVPPPVVHLGPCPAFDPLAPISLVPNVVSKAPVPTTYTYRTKLVSQTGSTKATYTGATRWKVDKASKPGTLGDYTYQVATKIPAAGFSKTTTYQVVPAPGLTADGVPVPGNVNADSGEGLPTDHTSVAGPANPGIYLAGVADSTGMSFVPATPIPLVQLPFQANATYVTNGTDGRSAIQFTSTVKAQTKVNACGTPVGVWEVRLTGGLLTSPGSPDVQFTETLDFASAAGGLVVGDNYASSSIEQSVGAASLHQVDVINTKPKDSM